MQSRKRWDSANQCRLQQWRDGLKQWHVFHFGSHVWTRNTHQSDFDHCKHKHAVAGKQGRKENSSLEWNTNIGCCLPHILQYMMLTDHYFVWNCMQYAMRNISNGSMQLAMLNSSPKNENLLNSPSSRSITFVPSLEQIVFKKKFSVILLAHQWILCNNRKLIMTWWIC